MTIERVERYLIEPHVGRIELTMRQGGRALGVAAISAAVLIVSWWFGPLGPRPFPRWAESGVFYWLWSGFFAVVFVLSLVGAVYREDWTITEREIVLTKSLGFRTTKRRVATGRKVAIRVEHLTDPDQGRIFPFRIRFLDADRNDSGLLVELQSTSSVDRFLVPLRAALTLEVDDQRRIPS
jgi:hypothetical protein